MREFINIIEANLVEEPDEPIVYHGTKMAKLSSPYRYPFFVTKSKKTAQGYAEDSGGAAQVFAFKYHPTKVADERTLRKIAKNLGIEDPDDPGYLPPSFELIQPLKDNEAQRVIDVLIKEGYDAVIFKTWGMDDSARLIPAIAILRDGVLTPA
jgi:hypothetical protein